MDTHTTHRFSPIASKCAVAFFFAEANTSIPEITLSLKMKKNENDRRKKKTKKHIRTYINKGTTIDSVGIMIQYVPVNNLMKLFRIHRIYIHANSIGAVQLIL